MNQLVISCSLSDTSHSRQMAQRLADLSNDAGDDSELLDLREWVLPFCDAGVSFDDSNVGRLSEKIAQAGTVTLAVPVYNFDVGGAARNLIALTGSSWNNQVVGFIGAAGGQRSYMALMPLANSLMLDFRCVIVPRFVYASRQSFDEGRLNDPKIDERLAQLAADLHHFAHALRTKPERGSQTA